MRTVSFVQHLEFEYQGNIFCKAISVGDVDNDKAAELIVGNIRGELLIFKGIDNKPWRRSTDLGMITCLEVGDVCNHGINCLVTLNADGWCHVFTVKPDPTNQEAVDSCDETRLLQPSHKQALSANSKNILMADIDGDGLCELVVGYSDRRVRSYRWVETADVPDVNPYSLTGRFVMIENWQLAGQIGSLSVNMRADGSVDLMASQPGGTFVTLLGSSRTPSDPGKNTDNADSDISGPSLVYHPLGSARARNPGVTTEVVGNITHRKKGDQSSVSQYSAICTHDGTLTLVDYDKILWSLYVDQQLFSLAKLDVTGSGMEDVVACSWDGQTYLVNFNRDAVRFQFGQNVAAFCAGYYAVQGSENVPCLIYATFRNQIHVYYNLQVGQIGISNLLTEMGEKEGVQDLHTYLNCDTSKPRQLRQLYHWCLYGFHPKAGT